MRALHQIQGVFLVPTKSRIRRLQELRGKRVMAAQRVAVIFQMAEATLRRHGLEPGRDVELLEARTHNNALSAPLRGEADASLTTRVLWDKLAPHKREALREIGRTPVVPGVVVLAHPRLAPSEVGRARAMLLGLAGKPDGAAYFARSGLDGFAPIEDRTMESFEPYLAAIEHSR